MTGNEQVDAIRALVAKGKSDRTIAKALGTTKGVVSGIIWRHGMRSGGVSAIKIRRDWTADEMVRIRALIAAGASLQAIGKDVGLARETVRCRFKHLGLTTQPSAQRSSRRILAANNPKVKATKKRAPSPSKPANTVCTAQVIVSLPKAPTPVVKHTGRISECTYVVSGERRSAIYCDKPTLGGKSMCSTHWHICYRPANTQQVAA